MLDKEQILSVLKANEPYLEAKFGVKRIGLFGSYARGQQSADSDIDIYVEMEKNEYDRLLAVLLLLEEKLGERVDLIHFHNNIRQSFLNTLQRETIYA